MRLMEKEGWHLFMSNSNTQLKRSGETTSMKSSGEEQKANPRRVLGKTLLLPFKPLGNHHTQQSGAGSSSGSKGKRRNFSTSQGTTKCCHKTKGRCLFSSCWAAAQTGQIFTSPGIPPSLHLSVTLCKALAFTAGERFGLQGPAEPESWDKFGPRDVLSPSMMRSETLNCYNNAEKPGKIGQQEELWTAGVLKRAVEMEGQIHPALLGRISLLLEKRNIARVQ